MKAMQIFKVSLVVLSLFALLVGCASTKPAIPADDQANMSQSDMSQQMEAKGVEEMPTKDDSAMMHETHESMAGLEMIHFDFDQFTLSAQAREILGNNAKFMAANADVKVVIEGHCDERGSDEYNLALGESRALAARNYLISLGVAPNRLSVISYGEEKPLVNASNESAWAQNRRAEFKSVR